MSQAARGILLLTGVLSMGVGCATTAPRLARSSAMAPAAAVGPFAIESGGGRDVRRAALDSLGKIESRLQNQLGLKLPADCPPIRVLVLDDQEQLSRLMASTHPELPARRAFFLEEAGERTIYVSGGDRLEEDLRHEATHAVLNASVGRLPLWLDEGLAEYFEVEEGDQEEVKRRATELRQAMESGWKPDLGRLESINSIRELTAADYRESWAWARMMVESEGARLLSSPGGPSATGADGMEVVQVRHRLGSDRRALAAAFDASISEAIDGKRPAVLRTQSPEVIKEAIAPVGRRSLAGRMLDRVGSFLFGP